MGDKHALTVWRLVPPPLPWVIGCAFPGSELVEGRGACWGPFMRTPIPFVGARPWPSLRVPLPWGWGCTWVLGPHLVQQLLVCCALS